MTSTSVSVVCYNRYYMRHVYVRTALLLVTFVIVASLHLSFARVTHATCKCIASESAALDRDRGVWTSVMDGGVGCDPAGRYQEGASCDPLTESYIDVWFCIPTVQDLIGNLIRILFFVAGLFALAILLLGGFEWVSSGGDEKKIDTARRKIIHAVVGLVVMVAVLTVVVLIEQVIFGGKLCLGISCPLDLGKLSIIENNSPGGRASCFGPASGSARLSPTSTASPSGTLTIPVSPATSSGTLAPTRRAPLIVTATPATSQSTSRQPSPTRYPPGVTVIVLPYGSGSASPTPGTKLPGTGGGSSGSYPSPTVPPL